MLTQTTENDSFQCRQTSKQIPALGHKFDPDLLCGCGKSWEEQRDMPSVCPLLIERLQGLEDMDRVLHDSLRRQRQLEEQLKGSLAYRRRERMLADVERLRTRQRSVWFATYV